MMVAVMIRFMTISLSSPIMMCQLNNAGNESFRAGNRTLGGQLFEVPIEYGDPEPAFVVETGRP